MANASLGLIAFVRRLADRDGRAATDRQLLERFDREQDQGAFAELVGRYGPMVLAACRRVLRHEQDAEDAFQATFLVLARKAARIRQSEALAGWLYRVAHRLALRAQSSRGKRQARFTALTHDIAERAAPALDRALEEEIERLPEQ